VATADIGLVAAELLRQTWQGARVVELEGPKRVTPDEIAATFAELLGRPVRMEAVREHVGAVVPIPGNEKSRARIGCWMVSTKAGSSSRAAQPFPQGSVALKTVLQKLIESATA